MNALLLAGGAAAVGAVLWSNAPRRFPLTGAVDPLAFSDLAATFPPGEDDFIREAWRYSAEHIRYERVGSVMVFSDEWVRCHRCLLPREVARRRRANCFGKALLLASLLRTRLPPDRVFVAVGTVTTPDIGGHSWVLVQHHGDWYVLEATRPPREWQLASDLQDRYHPTVLFNDVELLCQDEEMCQRVHRSACLPCMLAG